MLATARYFTFYLQEQGKLQPIYQEIQQLTPGTGDTDPASASIAIIEQWLDKPIAQIDTDFIDWFAGVD